MDHDLFEGASAGLLDRVLRAVAAAPGASIDLAASRLIGSILVRLAEKSADEVVESFLDNFGASELVVRLVPASSDHAERGAPLAAAEAIRQGLEAAPLWHVVELRTASASDESEPLLRFDRGGDPRFTFPGSSAAAVVHAGEVVPTEASQPALRADAPLAAAAPAMPRPAPVDEGALARRVAQLLYTELAPLLSTSHAPSSVSSAEVADAVASRLSHVSTSDVADAVADRMSHLSATELADTIAMRVPHLSAAAIADAVALRVAPASPGEVADAVVARMSPADVADAVARRMPPPLPAEIAEAVARRVPQVRPADVAAEVASRVPQISQADLVDAVADRVLSAFSSRLVMGTELAEILQRSLPDPNELASRVAREVGSPRAVADEVAGQLHAELVGLSDKLADDAARSAQIAAAELSAALQRLESRLAAVQEQGRTDRQAVTALVDEVSKAARRSREQVDTVTAEFTRVVERNTRRNGSNGDRADSYRTADRGADWSV